jgi:hypothetical protein
MAEETGFELEGVSTVESLKAKQRLMESLIRVVMMAKEEWPLVQAQRRKNERKYSAKLRKRRGRRERPQKRPFEHSEH